MLANNVDDMTSHETSKFKIFNLKTIANKLKYDYSLYALKVKSKAIPVTGREGSYVCETLRVPHYLDNRLKDGGKAVSHTCRPRFNPQENYK
jgi:hypothetical protein